MEDSKTYDVSNLPNARPGATAEKTLSKTGIAGVYRHPQSGQEAIAVWDPLTGNTQAEALMRTGFEYVRDVKDGDIKTLVEASIQNEQDKSLVKSNKDEVKGILARVNAMEAENAKLREELNSQGNPTTDSQDHAKEEAVRKTEERTSTVLTPSESGVNAHDVSRVSKTNKKGTK